MTLRTTIATDATTIFTSTDDFAEAVTYYPRGGGSRPINAVVFRESAEPYADDDEFLPVWQIHLANDDSVGIASTELDLGGDQLGFPPRDGEAAVQKSITRLLTQDHGMLVLECR